MCFWLGAANARKWPLRNVLQKSQTCGSLTDQQICRQQVFFLPVCVIIMLSLIKIPTPTHSCSLCCLNFQFCASFRSLRNLRFAAPPPFMQSIGTLSLSIASPVHKSPSSIHTFILPHSQPPRQFTLAALVRFIRCLLIRPIEFQSSIFPPSIGPLLPPPPSPLLIFIFFSPFYPPFLFISPPMFLPQLLHALFPFFPSLVLFFFPSAIQAQFRFDNLLDGIGMEAAKKMINGDLGQQNDPLRNVFGIWGRLLNRMAQKNPPSDDELHLKGAQEGDQEEGNVIGEDPEGLNFPPRGGGGFGGGSAKMFGGGSAKQPTGRDTVGKPSLSGPNKIIDEQRLNELLPRLSPNYAKEEKHSPETTTEKMTTTEAKTTTQPMTTTMTTTAETTMMAKTQLTTAKKTKEDEQKMAKKNKRRKKGRRKNAEEEDNGTKTNTTTMASPTPTPTNTSPIPINNGLINETQKTGQNQHFTTKVGETIHLSTSAEEKRKGQMEIIKETEFAGLNETVLERAENETAQLIAEIENVLADAEMGPNGHWLRQQMGDQNITTTRSWSSTMTTTDNKKEEETTVDSRNKTKTEEKQQQKEERSYEEEGAEREEEGESYETEESEEGKEEGEERNGAVQQEKQKKEDNTTMGETAKDEEGMRKSEETERKSKPMEENKQGTAEATTTWASTERPGSTAAEETQRMNGTKKGIPEAEEEDQHQQQQIAAQLQLDSAVTVSSPFPSPSPTTAQQTPQSAQNIFNLNANSNSYANPNFTNVMKPVNSIIDGIGPLILPLIGYSQRAFDAYAPLVAQRSEGLPIFRPSAMAAAPLLSPQQHQTHPLLPIGTSFSSGTVQQTQMPFPSQQSPQFPHAMPSSPSSSVKASPPNVAQPERQTHHSSAGNLETAKEAPSLEMLGRIIEERRKNEQKQRGNGNERKEISGSSPPEAELPYFPPNLPSNGPAHPFEKPIPERPVEKKTDQGYDAGRQTVHDTFHEDSGLMLGTQQTQSDQQTNGPMALPPAEVAFGNGKRPNGSFGFTRR